MKFYVYISDTKVDMLYEQIPIPVREKVATELKIDLKIFSTTFAQKSPEITRISKLDVVTRYIKQHENIGSVDKPESYFMGSIDMNWGAYPFQNPKMVYFGAKTDYTILGLGGSLNHVLGAVGSSICMIPFSYTPMLLSVLEQGERENHLPKHMANKVSELITLATESIVKTGAKQKLEFLAKRLAETYNPSEQKRVVLGTPVYVALAE